MEPFVSIVFRQKCLKMIGLDPLPQSPVPNFLLCCCSLSDFFIILNALYQFQRFEKKKKYV